MAVAPLNKFITIAVPVPPGEQIVYTAPTGVSSIVLYASVANVGVGTYPTVTFTHRRVSTASKTAGNSRDTRLIKNGEIPPQDSLIIVDGRLVLERSALRKDSIVVNGVQSGITTITNVVYDNSIGIATVTTIGSHGFTLGDEVTLSNIVFDCGSYPGITTTVFPDPQRSFVVESVIDSSNFTIDAGIVKGIPHTYVPAQHQFVSATTNAITANNGVQFTPTAATYNGSTGVLQLTIAGHNLTGSNTIQIANDSLSFRCSMDRYLSVHTYPRSTDPASGQNLSVTVIDGNTIQVNVGSSPSGGNVAPLQMELIMSILENSTT